MAFIKISYTVEKLIYFIEYMCCLCSIIDNVFDVMQNKDRPVEKRVYILLSGTIRM